MRQWFLISVVLVVVVLVWGAAPASAEGHEYIGSKGCKKCHLKQFKSWEKTSMAQSFESLKPGVKAEEKTAQGLDPAQDYTTDTDCIACHVTGYGKPGGFVDIETTPNLANVGCEHCHGAGGTYVQDGYMTLDNKEYVKADIVAVGMLAEVTEAQCVSCHSTDNPFAEEGFVFDFETSKEEGVHEHYPLKYEH